MSTYEWWEPYFGDIMRKLDWEYLQERLGRTQSLFNKGDDILWKPFGKAIKIVTLE